MDEMPTRAASLKLLGGRLSLDFTNTVDWRTGDHPEECLTTYSDLVAWSQHAGVLTGQQAQRVLREAARRPAEAQAVLKRAIRLREAIYHIFLAISRGRPQGATDLAAFNAELSGLLSRSKIIPAGEGFAWQWAADEDALDRMLSPVMRDALDLLTSEDLRWVRECPGDGCGWLFLDASRNRSRRWCAMEDCGNRAKARRHYRRTRAARDRAGRA
jgi:predicted RNA-binding Zn ribbon-like protein